MIIQTAKKFIFFYGERSLDIREIRLLTSIQNHINLLNAELNPICHLLALLGAHHILHVGRERVKKRPYPDILR